MVGHAQPCRTAVVFPGRNLEVQGVGIAVSQAENGSLIRLEGVMDISVAAELNDALAQAIRDGRPAIIDVAGVTNLDVTVWQLLWAMRRDAAHKSVECTFAGQLPEPVLSFLAEAGLADPAASEPEMQQ